MPAARSAYAAGRAVAGAGWGWTAGAWEQLDSRLKIRATLPVGALFCVLRGRTAGRRWESYLGITSVYLQGIDSAEIIDIVERKRPAALLAAQGGECAYGVETTVPRQEGVFIE